ncbi:MAG: ISAs1 family transposase [Rhodocyclaceae bacterium]|nr:ISAs1 family transposase [Rhodocyclaceae bacterium]MBX3671228.1 ISAs1 family transposase [Rhodocyclaceae bacterium]
MANKPKVTLVEALHNIQDPRRPSNGTRHNFVEMLVIAVCAMLSDCDNIEDIGDWAVDKESWLRQFLVLKNGIPSEETFLRLFRALDPKQFETAYRRWVGALVPVLRGAVAIDGKTLRGSRDGEVGPVHIVTAFATQSGIALGQEKVAAKSNEITAIPELLDALYVKGCIVTIDAMGCQTAIAAKIVDKKGDYLLTVKNNQPSLMASIEDAFLRERPALPAHVVEQTGHGRNVIQTVWAMPAAGIVDPAVWAKVKTLGMIYSERREGNKACQPEVRFYISSRKLSAPSLAKYARAHWGIENQLHWVLDVTFDEDASTVRKDNAPENLSLLKKIALCLLRTQREAHPRYSLRRMRKHAARDDDFLADMLQLIPLQ